MLLHSAPHRFITGILALVFTAAGSTPGMQRANADTSLPSVELPDFELKDPRGLSLTNDDVREDGNCLVVAFLGTECPLAKLYAQTLADLHDEFHPRQVSFVAVMSNRQDSLEEIATFERRSGLPFSIGKDLRNRLADALDAQRTPEVFLFDPNGELRYRGRVDDQYGIGTILDRPRRSDLREAIIEVLAGKKVSVPHTDAVGCIIGRRKSVSQEASHSADDDDKESNVVTYHQHINPILQTHCVECHREGEIGPFALDAYDEVAGWADMIAEVTRERRMPPWHAGPRSTAKFRNERTLSEQELDLLARWADTGTHEGQPTTRRSSDKASTTEHFGIRDENGRYWQLPCQPDHVFKITPKPVSIPATGEVKYQYYRVDPGFEKDVWASAMQLRPGNRSVVHHILVFAREPGSSQRLHAQRGFLDGYVPGYRAIPLAPGYAKRIPAGSELIFQVHYTPTGTPQQDLSEFAIVEAEESEISHEIRTDSVVQTRFQIPPGKSNHEVTARGPAFPPNSQLLAMMPHMHVRGKSFEYEMHTKRSWWSSQKNSKVLLDVPQYDFNWQTSYILAEPMPLPEGGRFVGRATYDNSEKNLSNPDPTATVRWGDQTWEEMMIGYYHYAVPRSND
ncbi:MAG: redoxin domain-containing protein [Rhodopirellula sp. JB044]|uniref:redoxin domain-containing protein n=1 Tax=Rhodopirellula sp. JB044 TaxID=3342844 RepID=UPI00370B98C8